MSIPEEIYKYLVTFSRVKNSMPYTNTAGPACLFCPQEFRSSKVLRHHFRMSHKDIVTGQMELNTHEESSITLDFENVQQETCVIQDYKNVQQRDMCSAGFWKCAARDMCSTGFWKCAARDMCLTRFWKFAARDMCLTG